jgi:hypothetical protein
VLRGAMMGVKDPPSSPKPNMLGLIVHGIQQGSKRMHCRNGQERNGIIVMNIANSILNGLINFLAAVEILAT